MTALLATLLTPFKVFAGYKVLLKSGEELYASNYWVDMVDNEIIRLMVKGGMTRIPRNEVLYIAPTSSGDQRIRTAIKRITFGPHPSAPNEAEIVPEPRTAKETKSQAPSPLQLDAEQLFKELEQAKEDFRQILKNGDRENYQEARDKIQDLTKQLNDLQEQAKSGNQGELPDWWCW